MIKRIDIYSRQRLVKEIFRSKGELLRNPKVRCITIHDTHREPAFSPRLAQHLILCFDDITPGWLQQEYPSCRLATPEDARRVVQFAKRINADGVERLIINCEAGISRSAAVATAIGEIFNVPEVNAHQGEIRPNRHVRQLIFHAAREAGLCELPTGASVFDYYDNDVFVVPNEDNFARQLWEE